jgi:hypothetical protein
MAHPDTAPSRMSLLDPVFQANAPFGGKTRTHRPKKASGADWEGKLDGYWCVS